MAVSKEHATEYARKYRAENKEHFLEYWRKRYHAVKANKERIARMGDKRCRACEIALKSTYGAYGTREYCRSCRDSGTARKHAGMLATRRWREKNKSVV